MNNQPPAGFFLRLLAFLNEKLIFLLLVALFIWNVSKSNTLNAIYQGLIVLLAIIIFYLLFGMAYEVLFTHYFGGNLGKLITGLRIRDQSGSKLDFKKILFRQLLAYQFSWLVFGLGYLSVLKDPKKQAWHDKTVDSNVFKVQSFLPLALLVFLLTLAGSGYLLKSSFENFSNNPAKQEVLGLIAAFNQQNQNSQIKDKQAPENVNMEIYQLFSEMSPNLIQDGDVKRVRQLITDKKYDESIKAINDLQPKIKNTADKTFVNIISTQAYLGKEDIIQAKKSAEEIISLSPNLSFGYYHLSLVNLWERNVNEALKNAKKAVEIDPKNADYHFLLGIALFNLRQINEAINETKKAIELDPKNEEYKKELELQQQQLTSTKSTTKTTTPTQTTSNQSTGPGYTQADTKSWQDELSFINQDLSNIPKFLGNSSYDQSKLNQMSTLLDQRKAIANQIYTKMVNNQTLTAQDEQTMNTYDQLTSQYASLANQVFPRQ